MIFIEIKEILFQNKDKYGHKLFMLIYCVYMQVYDSLSRIRLRIRLS